MTTRKPWPYPFPPASAMPPGHVYTAEEIHDRCLAVAKSLLRKAGIPIPQKPIGDEHV
jgi:hypothetical protein